jgi:hypothetical protein
MKVKDHAPKIKTIAGKKYTLIVEAIKDKTNAERSASYYKQTHYTRVVPTHYNGITKTYYAVYARKRK